MVSSLWRYVREKDKSLQKSLMEVRLSRLLLGWELAKMPSRDCLQWWLKNKNWQFNHILNGAGQPGNKKMTSFLSPTVLPSIVLFKYLLTHRKFIGYTTQKESSSSCQPWGNVLFKKILLVVEIVMFLVVLQISMRFNQLQVDLPTFELPVCPFDLSMNIYDSFSPGVLGWLERNKPCTLARH